MSSKVVRFTLQLHHSLSIFFFFNVKSYILLLLHFGHEGCGSLAP